MQRYNKKMKILFDSNQSIDYLRQNGLITIAFGECAIQTGEISNRLKELDKLTVDLPRIIEENRNIKQFRENVSLLSTENHNLKEQLSEKSKPAQKYKSEIDILNKEKEKLSKSNVDLTSKVETYEENIQSLQSEKKDLVTSLNHKEKSKKIEKKWRFICDRYLTYQRLRNLAKVVSIFTEYPDKEWRQRQVATHEELMKIMSSPTIIRHLYDARDRGIIHCPVFPGTYKLNLPDFGGMGADMDVLVRYIVGDEIYDIALMQAIKKREFKHH